MLRAIAEYSSLTDLSTDLLVVAVTSTDLRGVKRKLTSITFEKLNNLMSKSLSKNLKKEGFEAEMYESSFFKIPGRKDFRALLLIGWNNPDGGAQPFAYRKLGSLIFRKARLIHSPSVAISPANLKLFEEKNFLAFYEGLQLSGYNYEKYRSEKSLYKGIQDVQIVSRRKIPAKFTKKARALCEGTELARDLSNMPAKDCTPAFLVKQSRNVASEEKLRCEVYDQKRLEKIGAGLLLSVSQGSDQKPYLTKLTYRPQKASPKKKIALVGKGVTFDTGGYSIKNRVGMEGMKRDMSGGAAILGAMQAVGKLKPDVEVRAYLPFVENMINGKATRPGDVIKSYSGKTVEILNTDAEGRLILADALALAEKDGADIIIDLATLTGACKVALGDLYGGIFSSSDVLCRKLCEAGEAAGEKFWELPLAQEYRPQLNSSIADIKSTGTKFGGAITAALFLKEFIQEATWAHLDISGASYRTGDLGHLRRGSTGFGVRTIVHYILSL